MCVYVCVFYLRLCVDVGTVGDEFLHHLCLPSQGSYVKSCVPFLVWKKGKHLKMLKLLSVCLHWFVYTENWDSWRQGPMRDMQ